MAKGLKESLSEAVLKQLAGAKTFARGKNYLRGGAVDLLNLDADWADAVVRGGLDYEVELRVVGGQIQGQCNCPMGVNLVFCKHVVALGLAVLDKSVKKQPVNPGQNAAQHSDAQLKRALEAKGAKQLAGLILEWAHDNVGLLNRLHVFLGIKEGVGLSAELVELALIDAIEIEEFIYYGEGDDWVQNVHSAIDQVQELFQAGDYQATINLCETGLSEISDTIEMIDDGSDYLTELRDRLEGLHYEACMNGKPDREELARSLFSAEIYSDLNVFREAPERYAAILGEEGFAKYRTLVEAQLARYGTGIQLSRMMESLARATGDINDLVRLKSTDLSSPYRYLELGRVCREAKQFDVALAWAEKGMKAFPSVFDTRLREFAAEEHERAGNFAIALELRWLDFEHLHGLAAYEKLALLAKRAGEGAKWREKALDYAKSVDRELLARIHLHEKDVEAAWTLVQVGSFSETLILQIARARETHYPAESGAVYLRMAESMIVYVNNAQYDDAVAMLVAAAKSMAEAGRSRVFEEVMDGLRVKFKIKRNFMKLVDENLKELYRIGHQES